MRGAFESALLQRRPRKTQSRMLAVRRPPKFNITIAKTERVVAERASGDVAVDENLLLVIIRFLHRVKINRDVTTILR